MSGPSLEKKLYDGGTGVDWDEQKVNQLRELADRVDDGLLVGDDSELPNDQVANLLRVKADKIEAAIRTIDTETSQSYNQLVRAIQYNYSGDYGVKQVKKAWEEYAEKEQ